MRASADAAEAPIRQPKEKLRMDSLLATLKKALEPNALDHLGYEELKDVRKQLGLLEKRARDRMLEITPPPDSDPDYIDLIIDGQRDRIKRDIEVLNISCNNFEKLPDAIYQLKNLKKLYLFNNSFSAEEKRTIRQQFHRGVHIYF